MLRLLAVPLGVAGIVLVCWGLIESLLSLNLHSRLALVLLALAAFYIVVDALVALWDRLPARERRRARTSCRWRSRWLLRSRPLSLWPVVLVLLTSLLGVSDWFPAQGWSRPMMLGLITAVGIYGYFRERADQKKTLLAFADVARYRFSEAAEQIHAERDREAESRNREIESRNREYQSRNREHQSRNRDYQSRSREVEKGERIAEIDRLIDDLQDRYAELKATAQLYDIPFRNLIDTAALREQLGSAGFTPNDAEFQYILTRLGLSE